MWPSNRKLRLAWVQIWGVAALDTTRLAIGRVNWRGCSEQCAEPWMWQRVPCRCPLTNAGEAHTHTQ